MRAHLLCPPGNDTDYNYKKIDHPKIFCIYSNITVITSRVARFACPPHTEIPLLESSRDVTCTLFIPIITTCTALVRAFLYFIPTSPINFIQLFFMLVISK